VTGVVVEDNDRILVLNFSDRPAHSGADDL
jgi:hypothetical protein